MARCPARHRGRWTDGSKSSEALLAQAKTPTAKASDVKGLPCLAQVKAPRNARREAFGAAVCGQGKKKGPRPTATSVPQKPEGRRTRLFLTGFPFARPMRRR